MQDYNKHANMSPESFELFVKDYLEYSGAPLKDFQAEHREKIEGVDGTYEIDVSARFEALGAQFLILIECKCHHAPIKREVVQILYDRLRAIGAHKGMLFATTSFQKGAIEYAKTHGIALITVSDQEPKVIYQVFGPIVVVPKSPWAKRPGDVAWVVCPEDIKDKLQSIDKLHLINDISHMELLWLFLDFHAGKN